MKYTKLFVIAATALLFSCSNYINKMYSDLDRQDQVTDQASTSSFDKYRNPPSTYRNGNDVGRVANAAKGQPYYNQNNPPPVRRNYIPKQNVRKRYKADDLLDNSSNNGSLWAGKGKAGQLFTNSNEKKNGDIVLINVQKILKNDITLELKRAFPDIPEPATTKDGEKKEEDVAETTTATEGGNKIYDRVSSVIVEEINEDHLLLRGQKSVLFKQRKRLVEVQALVSRRDITDEDTVNSDAILESSVHILR